MRYPRAWTSRQPFGLWLWYGGDYNCDGTGETSSQWTSQYSESKYLLQPQSVLPLYANAITIIIITFLTREFLGSLAALGKF